MTIETSAPFRRVVGTLISGVAFAEADVFSGLQIAGATVIFTASIRSARTGQLIVLDPVPAVTDDDARLVHATTGQPGVPLLVTDDPAVGATGWTWRVEIRANRLSSPVVFDIDVPSGEGDLDLATLVPVPGNVGEDVILWRAAVEQTAANLAASEAIVATSVDDARLDGDDLELIRRDGSVIPVGNIRGREGKSAYELWLDAGNTGTIEDWQADQKGRDGSNVLPSDIANAEQIEDRASAHSRALFTAVASGTRTLVASRANFPAIDDTGSADTSGSVQALLDAAQPGSTLVFSGTYRIGTALNVNPIKLLTLNLNSATFVRTGTDRIWNCINTPDETLSFTNVTSETTVIDGHTATVSVLNFPGAAPSWGVADRVRVVADDVIPGAHITSNTLLPRVGEYATVSRVQGNKVYLRRQLREVYATNPRVARIPYGSVRMHGGRYDVTDQVIAAKMSGQVMRLEGLISPLVDSPIIVRWVGTGISLRAVQSYDIRNAVTEFAMNDIGEGILGYGIHDSNCEDGVISGGSHHGTRHAFTDGTPVISAGNPNVLLYGRSYNMKMRDVTSTGSTSAAFDTHGMSMGMQFINCTAYCNPEVSGFALRSIGHSVIGGRVFGGNAAVSVYNQASTGWSRGQSYGSVVTDLYADGVDRVFQVIMHESADDPLIGQRDAVPNLDISNVRAVRSRRLLMATNGNVRMSNVSFSLPPVLGASVIDVANTLLTGGNYEIDATAVTSYTDTTRRLIGASDPITNRGSNVYVRGIRLSTSLAFREGAVNPLFVSTNTRQFCVDDLEVIGGRWASRTAFDVFAGDRTRSVTWRYRDVEPSNALAQHSSAAAVLADAEISSVIRMVGASRDPQLVITANVTQATPRTITQILPGQFDGQRLAIIMGSNAASVTVVHGSTANTRLVGGTNVTLSNASAALHLMWSSGAWREVTRVS